MSRIINDEDREEPIAAEVQPEQTEQTEESYEEYYELPESISRRNRIWSVLSLVTAILSVLLCPFYYVSLPFAVLAVVFAIVMRRALGFFEQMSVLGLIIGIVGLVFSACSLTVQVSGLWEMIVSEMR